MKTLTRKITLKIVGENKKEKTKYISDISELLMKVGNKIIRQQILDFHEIDTIMNDGNMNDGKITQDEARKQYEEKIGTSLRNHGYQLTTEYNNINSSIRTGFNSTIFKTISHNYKDITNGKMSIPSFTKNKINIPLNSIEIKKDENEKYFIIFPLSSSEKKIRSESEIKLELHFGRDRSDNRTIVNRIFDKTYKMCDSLISVVDDEITLMLIYQQPENNNIILDINNIMGVDVGMNRLVTFNINNIKYQPDQIVIGEKIHHDRFRFEKQRKNLQEQLTYSTGGHGRSRKLEALNILRRTESNWSTNINHVVSRSLIDIAVKYKVGVIKMEDLTGITKKAKDYYLKSWKYYQLQEFIKYKAELVGIKILWVNPRNTSITCPSCGEVHKENRSNKDKTIFKCINEKCEHFNVIKDADIVGATNITNTFGEELKPKSKKGKIEKHKLNYKNADNLIEV